MAKSPSPSRFLSTTAVKTWGNILLHWLTEHMDTNCVADAYPRVIKPVKNQPPPLHFKSTIHILGRCYCLELQKAPFFYWMQEFTVTLLQHIAESPASSVAFIVTDEVVSQGAGFYRVVSEMSADYEYLVRVHVTRC